MVGVLGQIYPSGAGVSEPLPCISYAPMDNPISNFLDDLTSPLYLSHRVLIVLLETNGMPPYKLGRSILAVVNAMPGGVIFKTLVVSIPIWILVICLAAAVHFLIVFVATPKPSPRVPNEGHRSGFGFHSLTKSASPHCGTEHCHRRHRRMVEWYQRRST